MEVNHEHGEHEQGEGDLEEVVDLIKREIPEEKKRKFEGYAAEILAALECIDFVTIFEELTPLELINYLKPDLLIKGGDWPEEKVVGREEIKEWGGRVAIIPEVEGKSTTNIVEKIKKLYCSSN